jgi:hypothetical protein
MKRRVITWLVELLLGYGIYSVYAWSYRAVSRTVAPPAPKVQVPVPACCDKEGEA